MQLELSLGTQFVWALVEPRGKEFIKVTRKEKGYQEVNLILTQSHPGPVKIHLEDFPAWAQKQIKAAVRSGQLINTGDKIESAIAAPTVENLKVEPEVQQTEKPSNKKGAKNK